MAKATDRDTRKSSGVQSVSALAISTHSVSDAFARMLRPFSAKEIANRLQLPSWRTVENWKEGKTSPQAKHVVAMLHDDELCALLLADVIGRKDAAHQIKVEAARRRLKELEEGT